MSRCAWCAWPAPSIVVGPLRAGVCIGGCMSAADASTTDARHEMTPQQARAYCRAVLPRVSRTFALNIGILRGELRDAVCCAYLLCRIADTIEDSPQVDAAQRAELLAAYRRLFPLGAEWRAEVDAWSRRFAPLADRGADLALCARTSEVFTALAALCPELRTPIEDCVREMSDGMAQFAARRTSAADGRLRID